MRDGSPTKCTAEDEFVAGGAICAEDASLSSPCTLDNSVAFGHSSSYLAVNLGEFPNAKGITSNNTRHICTVMSSQFWHYSCDMGVLPIISVGIDRLNCIHDRSFLGTSKDLVLLFFEAQTTMKTPDRSDE